MNFQNKTVLEKISLVIIVLTLICLTEATFHHVIFPIDFSNPNSKYSFMSQYTYIIVLICGYILSWISFILGIVMLIQKKLSKKIAIISLLTGLPIVLTFIISFVQGLMIRFGI